MAFKNNYANDINRILLTKRSSDDDSFTLTIPEHKFKKNAEKFNFALRQVYDSHTPNDIKMFHIILSLTQFFDMDWLVKNVLDRRNKALIKQEMQDEYNVKLITRKSHIKPKDIDDEQLEFEKSDSDIVLIDDDDDIDEGI